MDQNDNKNSDEGRKLALFFLFSDYNYFQIVSRFPQNLDNFVSINTIQNAKDNHTFFSLLLAAARLRLDRLRFRTVLVVTGFGNDKLRLAVAKQAFTTDDNLASNSKDCVESILFILKLV